MNKVFAKLILIFGISLGLVACNGATDKDKSAQGESPGTKNEQVAYSIIEYSSNSIFSKKTGNALLVAKNMTEAEFLWNDYQEHKEGVPTVMPSIDFNQNMLVSVPLMAPTPCHTSEVIITKEAEVLVVTVTHKQSDLIMKENLSCMQVLAASTMVLTMPKSDLPLQLRAE